jgi:hypothetical protein
MGAPLYRLSKLPLVGSIFFLWNGCDEMLQAGWCLNGHYEDILLDITDCIYDESGEQIPTEMANGHQAELDPSEWVAITGINPMDPTEEGQFVRKQHR